jgi:cytochrome b
MASSHPLWDWPTRLFHWSLVAVLPLAWWTAEEGHYEWHEWLGYGVIVLVTFRLAWGFIGSQASRFRSFLRGPRQVMAYVGRGMREGAEPSAGHNPLGGWYVLGVLLLLLLQAVSGLFNSDDILFDGPLHHLVDSDWQGWFGEFHELAFDLILALICVHILAVAYHQWGRGEPLIQAMLRGRAEGKSGLAPPAPGWLALCCLLLVGGALWILLSLVPAPVSPW